MAGLEVAELESGAFKAFAQAFVVLIESNGSVEADMERDRTGVVVEIHVYVILAGRQKSLFLETALLPRLGTRCNHGRCNQAIKEDHLTASQGKLLEFRGVGAC